MLWYLCIDLLQMGRIFLYSVNEQIELRCCSVGLITDRLLHLGELMLFGVLIFLRLLHLKCSLRCNSRRINWGANIKLAVCISKNGITILIVSFTFLLLTLYSAKLNTMSSVYIYIYIYIYICLCLHCLHGPLLLMHLHVLWSSMAIFSNISWWGFVECNRND